MKRKVNSFILFFCVPFSFAQIDVKFVHHLAKNDLVNEHKTYLNSVPLSDSTYYLKAKFNLQYPNDSLFIVYYFQSKNICQTDTLLLKQASDRFLKINNKTLRDTWFNSLPENNDRSIADLKTVYKASLDPNLYPKEIFPYGLQKSYSKYKKVYNKKPFLAAVFSACIPGSGKLYAGKTQTFFLTFLLNAVYAVQTIESAQKLGTKHAFTFVNAGAFTVFYLSNIYGSYRAVIDLRKERKKQFIIDATNFYN